MLLFGHGLILVVAVELESVRQEHSSKTERSVSETFEHPAAQGLAYNSP